MAANEATRTTEQLRADLDQLRANMSEVMSAIGRDVGNRGRQGMRGFYDVRDRTQAQARKSLEAVEDQVVDRPLTSVLVALGIGVLIGAALDWTARR